MFKLSQFTPEVECRTLISSEDKCYFVLHTEDCSNADGIFNYLSLLYCDLSMQMFSAGVFFLGVWTLVLFVALATSANSFFCPSLKVLSKKMAMSDNVAGVTLLALGNGAPDIFSSLAGIRQGRASLAFGELFGAGILVTTIVAGSVCFIKPFHVMERPFLRDCTFYLGAVYFVFWVFYHKSVHLGHAIGFIALYIFYVIIVVLGRVWNSRTSNSYIIVTENSTVNISNNQDEPATNDQHNLVGEVERGEEDVWRNLKDEFLDLFNYLKPFSIVDWVALKWYEKIILAVQAPFLVIFKFTIPSVNDEYMRNGWCRSLQCIQMGLTPSWIAWAVGYGDVLIAKFIPLPMFLFFIGISFGFLLAFFTQRKTQPKYHWLFSFGTFLVSVVWIDMIANEILAVLFTFGVVFQLSDAILGLTILAWGNSIGDFVADVAMAKQNAPRMGFSACYGAPLLNTLLGLGIAFVAACSQINESIPVSFTHLSQIMTIFLLISLITVLIYLPLNQFQASKCLGMLLFGIYFAFVFLALLQEAGIFWPQVL